MLEIANYPLFMGEGPQAQNIVLLWWILFGICAFVLLAVSIFTFLAIFRKKGEKLTSDEALGRGLGWGIGITISLLLVIIISTFKLSQPLKAEKGTPASIEVVGKMWWWEVIYRDETGTERFRTANEIVLPVGEPTKLKITSDTVIHSFWVPALAGKMDMIPGRSNYLTLMPKSEGAFRGQCAEFCGIQHALMAFFVKVKSKDKYRQWLKDQNRAYQGPNGKSAMAGERVFLDSCAKCHSVRGLNQAKNIKERGPDLTHLASRESLAAGSLINSRGHLAGWIADPQSSKPGNYMPASKLAPEDFKHLLNFLEGLK